MKGVMNYLWRSYEKMESKMHFKMYKAKNSGY